MNPVESSCSKRPRCRLAMKQLPATVSRSSTSLLPGATRWRCPNFRDVVKPPSATSLSPAGAVTDSYIQQAFVKHCIGSRNSFNKPRKSLNARSRRRRT
jgi:hypothetical protein